MDTKIFRLIRKILEQTAADAVAKGADPTEYDVCFPIYKQDDSHAVGDIRRNPETDQPFECITAYDGAVHPDWTLSVGTLWRPYHGKDAEHAYPWAAPTGAQDIYKAGEFMTFTDGKIYKCLQDTNFSPTDYPQAWQAI